jgi:hypothetical protein
VKEHPRSRAIVLRNINCAYCGRLFDAELPATKEHVIGRRFVPRGCFAGQWNLILNACGRCNGDKAELEDDISAITMMPDAFGCHAIADDRHYGANTPNPDRNAGYQTGSYTFGLRFPTSLVIAPALAAIISNCWAMRLYKPARTAYADFATLRASDAHCR